MKTRNIAAVASVLPQFPEFKPIAIEDRDLINRKLEEYQPETSELTFANMFIWRLHYGFLWSTYEDWLLAIGENGKGVQALPPIGPPSRVEVTRMLLQWMKEERGVAEPGIDRADARLVAELEESGDFLAEPVREHFDYVYRTEELIRLSGGAYRAKRNHLNYLLRSFRTIYEPVTKSSIGSCLGLAATWCKFHQSEEDPNVLGEWDAIREALHHFGKLQIEGGTMLVNGRPEAFSLGERLNRQTAVVHIEKANTEIRGLYNAINQQFCERQWADTPFINREQDLGEPGLRKAKLSYNPDHLVEKFRIRLK